MNQSLLQHTLDEYSIAQKFFFFMTIQLLSQFFIIYQNQCCFMNLSLIKILLYQIDIIKKQTMIEINNNLLNVFRPLCTKGESALFVCFDKCNSCAFMCENQQCTCHAAHINCHKPIAIQELYNHIQKKKKAPSLQIQNIFKGIAQIYDKIIDKISEDRVEFMDYTQMFGLDKNMIKFYQLFHEQKQQQIVGELINKIWQQNSKQIYSPLKMTNYENVRDMLAQIQLFLGNLSYQLADQTEKLKRSLTLTNQQDLSSTVINCSQQRWEFIPPEIKVFKDIEELYINTNHIRKLTNLECFSQLTRLDIQKNQISKIENFDKLTNLTKIYMHENRIKKIQGFDKLVNLQILALRNNCIEEIENLENLTKLTELGLSDNQIKQIKNLDKLVNIECLWLKTNKITKVQNLEKLIKLKTLILSDNNIRKIEGIDNLVNLQQLGFSNCNIQKLQNIFHLKKLKKIFIYKNPLLNNDEDNNIIEEMKQNGIKVKIISDDR